jgi:hypothetical protein
LLVRGMSAALKAPKLDYYSTVICFEKASLNFGPNIPLPKGNTLND